MEQPGKAKFTKLLETIPEVLECYHVTGADSYVMKVVAIDMQHLERLIARINIYGETRTSIVMSTVIAARACETQSSALVRSPASATMRSVFRPYSRAIDANRSG